ncbi:MAG: hypothetical protein H6581_16330 [Bacteroidia bacterium]|nr:hypothetical protein [Bacteroidia bacterium]
MEFYIELTGPNITYRHQTDGSWKEIRDRDLKESDFISNSIIEIKDLQKVDSQINLAGKLWTINPTAGKMGDTNKLHYEVYVKHSSKPPLPLKKQLITIIENGIDEIFNTLILNINGQFELRDFSGENQAKVDPSVVVRYETFTPGNGYVGKDASKDMNHVTNYYVDSLRYWLMHLDTGGTYMFSDDIFMGEENDLIQKINAFKFIP